MTRIITLVGVLALILLSACSSPTSSEQDAAEPAGANAGVTVPGATAAAVEPAGGEPASGDSAAEAVRQRLAEDYTDALPVQAQLALGTLQLENTDLAISPEQAEELLTLWRALQSLANSDTTAAVELQAVANQIQDAMSPEQVAAIAEMALTQDKVRAMIEDGSLGFGQGGFGRGADGAPAEGALPPGGFPEGGFGPGGGPGAGGGFGPGGGLEPGADPSALATRRAERFSDDDLLASFMDRALSGAVIRLLEVKTGQAPEDGAAGGLGSVLTIVGEATGLTVEEIQTQMADSKSLAEVIAGTGGDVEAVRTALAEALADSPWVQGQDLDAFVDNLLQGGFSNRFGQGQP
ncbi:MAG: hypothetical protein ACWGPS_03975 [Candidatus Promineifilaceae bacterium]